ncbi:hypothetical protein MYX04_15340, partial [Nitrospiraceae bacterium AH_259_D15_M11_P09]|nr:hypothetical protein [Nitrospiraceae bacterium AH_259_D15_M11_P09]
IGSWSGLVMLALIVSTGALYAAAQGKGKKNAKETPVTVTYRDDNTVGMKDDLLGPYSGDDRRVRKAVLTSGGKLILDTRGHSAG